MPAESMREKEEAREREKREEEKKRGKRGRGKGTDEEIGFALQSRWSVTMEHSVGASTRAFIRYELSNYIIIRGRVRSRCDALRERLVKFLAFRVFDSEKQNSLLSHQNPLSRFHFTRGVFARFKRANKEDCI